VFSVYQWRIAGILMWPSCGWHMASFVTSDYLQVSFSWQCAHTVWMWCQHIATCW
jgi:hypothetical protein